jgi:phage tail sheath protein FI
VALPPPPGLIGLILDPTVPADLARIVGYQEELVDLAETLRSFVLLLDVPPGLDQRRMLDWRACFDSSFAAAYHPWLDVARPDDGRDAKARINASAFAAGIVAHRERLFGVPYGPSNELAARVVALADEVSPERHAELHQAAVNVFVRERDGIRLSASRTLSLDPLLRQLSVRRLMTMLVRTLDQEMQWAVFEPNGEALHAQLRYLLGSYLRRLYRANAFAGATEAEAFFVRCDETTMTQNDLDNGRLVALVGVAPVEPLEFLVVRIARNVGGELTVEGPGG